MAQIISNLVQNVGGGIGFVSEAYKAHRASKTQKQVDANSHQLENSPGGTTPHEADEEAWGLDEAQDDIISPETMDPNESTDPITLAEAFLLRLPSSLPPATHQKLPYPIIIPQRRPTDRSRGIITAYPPILSTRSISQATFLDFICTFNKSTQATKWIAALNLASIATVMLPTVTSILVSMAITAATTAAMELQGWYKTNRFLDKVNKEFFMPKGLFCLVLTWNPETKDASTTVDFDAVAKKVMEKGTNPLTALRKSNGKTYGEFQWPETAPLIYPAVDDLATASGAEGQAKKSSLQKKRRFVEDYMDRRAQAKFAMDNPNSALAAGPKPTFSSRYADPAHAANSGSLAALISGGAIQLPERSNILSDRGGRGEGSRMGGRAVLGRGFGGATEDPVVRRDTSEINNTMQRGLGALRGGRGGSSAGPLGLVQKVMKKDVLYLLIVDMPSDDELAAAQEVATELLAGERRN
ncbi:hypothetical protein E4T52_00883 [Aureobasidium sp. EXF-3400]|nr:hypothetical protein E4T51_00680 [Aureobasidium sp. EXF-12344]KAI4784254.1 hypothetical protein E4T52_00883 [Aureobasidium sp. EXF-3400]